MGTRMDLTVISAQPQEAKISPGHVSSASSTFAVLAIRRKIIRRRNIPIMPILSSMPHMRIDYHSTKKVSAVMNVEKILNTVPGSVSLVTSISAMPVTKSSNRLLHLVSFNSPKPSR